MEKGAESGSFHQLQGSVPGLRGEPVRGGGVPNTLGIRNTIHLNKLYCKIVNICYNECVEISNKIGKDTIWTD